MARTLWYRIALVTIHEDQPAPADTPLLIGGVAGRPRYSEVFADASNETDWAEYRVLEARFTAPSDDEVTFLEGTPETILNWYSVEVPDDFEIPPDLDQPDGPGPDPEPEVDPGPPVHVGRWTTGWVDAQGLTHYYPPGPDGWTPLYPDVEAERLAGIEETLLRMFGTVDGALFHRIARALGITPSTDRMAEGAAPATVTARLRALDDAAMSLLDAMTVTGAGAEARIARALDRALDSYFAAGAAAAEAVLQALDGVAGLTGDARAELVEALTESAVMATQDAVSGYRVVYALGDVDSAAESFGAQGWWGQTFDMVFSAGRDGIDADLPGQMRMGPGDDIARLARGDVDVFGGAGDDEIDARWATEAGQDGWVALLSGGTGADRIFGSGFAEDLRGDGGADVLMAGGDSDSVRGGGGADRLNGGTGNDRILGQGGRDTLNGGQDDDRMTGGAGADVFRFDIAAFGQDRITDFADGTDRLLFTTAVAGALAAFEIAGNGTRSVTLTLGEASVTLTGQRPITITEADVLFL